VTEEQAAEVLATLRRIEELMRPILQTQERMARALQILVGSVQHGR